MKITIITVVYNGHKTIEQTIKSVCDQTRPPDEYIIIDGKSTDETLKIVLEYQKMHPFIKVISEKDKGIYDAMNKGISLSSGSWLCFMNADDKFHDDKILEYVENKIIDTNNQIKLLYGIAKLIDSQLNVSFLKGKKVSLQDFYWNQPIVHQATFFKRDVFEDIGYYEEALIGVGDYEWYVRFFCEFDESKALFVEKTIADFSMGGITSDILWQNFRDRRNIAKKYFPFIINLKYLFSSPYFYIKFKLLSLLKNTEIYSAYRKAKVKIKYD